MRYFTSFQNLLLMDISFLRRHYFPKTKMFFETYKNQSCVWVSLYSKGSLWKIKVNNTQWFDVYYGTEKICYCTNFVTAIQFIIEKILNYEKSTPGKIEKI